MNMTDKHVAGNDKSPATRVLMQLQDKIFEPTAGIQTYL